MRVFLTLLSLAFTFPLCAFAYSREKIPLLAFLCASVFFSVAGGELSPCVGRMKTGIIS